MNKKKLLYTSHVKESFVLLMKNVRNDKNIKCGFDRHFQTVDFLLHDFHNIISMKRL